MIFFDEFSFHASTHLTLSRRSNVLKRYCTTIVGKPALRPIIAKKLFAVGTSCPGRYYQTIAECQNIVTKYKYRYFAKILLNYRYNYFNKKVLDYRYNYFYKSVLEYRYNYSQKK